ncbi:MAG: LysR family transcriptional regulator [Proteobacteria bacterium]|nr:LysR family transcriptional regulator [Pseudomonadota bacterium]
MRRGAIIDIRQLRYFVEVLEAGSLRKAADRLHIAQTALGRQVKLLEDEFGKPLLNRHPRGISPTEAGQRLEFYALELLHSVDDIHHRMAGGEETMKGKGTFGVPAAIAQFLFGAMAARLAKEQPDIEVAFVEGNAYTLWSGLETDEIDLAILIEPERQDNFDYEVLLAEQMFLISRSDDPSAPEGPLSIADVAQRPLVVYRRPTGPRKILDRAMARFNAVPNIVYEVEHPLVAVDLVTRGLAQGILSASDIVATRLTRKLVSVEIENFKFDRTLVRRKKSRNQAVADILTRIAREEFLKFHDAA